MPTTVHLSCCFYTISSSLAHIFNVIFSLIFQERLLRDKARINATMNAANVQFEPAAQRGADTDRPPPRLTPDKASGLVSLQHTGTGSSPDRVLWTSSREQLYGNGPLTSPLRSESEHGNQSSAGRCNIPIVGDYGKPERLAAMQSSGAVEGRLEETDIDLVDINVAVSSSRISAG